MFAHALTRIFLPLLLTASALGQIAEVAHTASTTGGATPAINITGATMIAVCGYAGRTYTDSSSNAYTQVYQPPVGYGGANPALFVSFNPAISTTLTVSSNGSSPFSVSAFSNVASGPDQTAPATSVNAYPLPIGPITPTNANELIYGCFMGNFPGVSSPSASFSGMTTNSPTGLVASGNAGTADAYLVQTTAAAFSTNVTMNQSNGADGYMVSFFSTTTPGPLSVVTTDPLPEAVVGSPYTTALSVPGSSATVCLAAKGGVQPYTWAKTSGTYPSGIAFNTSTGCFSGTPTASVLQTPLVFSVTDSHATVANSVTLHLTVVSAAMSFAATTCPAATQNAAYAGCTLTTTGGTGTYAYAIDRTQYFGVPEGMILNASTGAITSSKVNGQGIYSPSILVSDTGGGLRSATATISVAGDNSAEDVHTMLPADHVVRLRVDTLPVDTAVYAQEYSAYAGQNLRPGFGRYTYDGGIPITTVTGVSPPLTSVTPTGIPAPDHFYSELTQTFAPCDAAIENGWNNTGTPPGVGASNDNHILVYNPTTRKAVEHYQSYPGFPATTYGAPGCTIFGSGGHDIFGGAVGWDFNSYTARGTGVSSSDAGGLCLLCYLLKYDEVASGPAGHAIRMTLNHTLNYHVFPATVQAGSGSGSCSGGSINQTGGNDITGTYLIDPANPPTTCDLTSTPGNSLNPMGQIYRLRSAISQAAGGGAAVAEPAACSSNAIMHNVFLTLQQYGMIVADNGNTNTLVGTQDARWPDETTVNNCVSAMIGTQFEPVNIRSKLLSWPNSYQTATGSTTYGGPTQEGFTVTSGVTAP